MNKCLPKSRQEKGTEYRKIFDLVTWNSCVKLGRANSVKHL